MTTTTHTPADFNKAVQAALTGAAPTPKRRDTKAGRFYEIDEGVLVPSVTHVLSCIGKPALINWAANTERALVIEAAADLYLDLVKTPPMGRMAYVATLNGRIGKQKAHQRELAKAAEIGTQAHGLIEWNIRRALGQKVGPEPRVVDAAQWAFMAFQDWAGGVGLKPLAIEQTVFSKVHGYAGTMDLLAEVDGVKTLVDFKTSKAIYAEAHLQTAAYRVALNEMGHGPVSDALILRLPKLESDPQFEVQASPAIEVLFPVFLAVMQLWKWWWAEEQRSKAAWQAKKDAAV
jgi:hypothetical protein